MTDLEELYKLISDNKKEKIENISKERTYHITIVLENITNTKDISAVLRTCECFGIQNIHIIDTNDNQKINIGVAMGSFKWLNINYYSNINDCLNYLKNNKYDIIAFSHKNSDCLLEEININNKIAICIGSEETGLSDEFLISSNYICKIPIYGKSESYNISTSAGISIYSTIRRLKNSDINWKLDNNQLLELKTNWVKKLKKI